MHGFVSYRRFGKFRSLRSDQAVCVLGRYVLGLYVVTELGWSSVATLSGMLLQMAFYIVCKLAGFLKTLEYWPRDKFWDLVSGCLILCLEMLETSVLGLGQDLGLITALGGVMTTSTYVSRIVFDLIPSRFKVRDMFSAYVTCMVGIEHLFEDNF
ncbi:hypothetical protein DY000_02015594 [Brassica cretica]|uniref:Solute carrier family 40 protein n=1 Tax=Brassica cretica TaxID=69181 RepID=A0ABQ7CV20_BRACR|nr:hypothetical protein DY000_02015594 [Brassica cretica]